MKNINKALVGIVIITFIVCLSLIWGVEKNFFVNYRSFLKQVDYTVYPNTLPESAHDMKYYAYKSLAIDKSGYKATFSLEDYRIMKQERIERYNQEFPWECYWYTGNERIFQNRVEMEQLGIDFMDELLPIEDDNGNYYFLGYSLCEGASSYSYAGALCNDDTCEIIEFTYRKSYDR